MTLCNADILTGLTELHLQDTPGGFKLHTDAAAPFAAMCQAAKADGIAIQIVSSFRSYQRQAAIWQAKLSGKRTVFDQHGVALDINAFTGKARLDAVLLYSALPGASRHHWGTDIDVFDAAAVAAEYQPQLTAQEYGPTGPFCPLQQWLARHAADFGFFQPYQQYLGGIAVEPWHLSYQPVAQHYLAQFTVSQLRECIVRHPIAEQQLVLQYLDAIFNQYVSNICRTAL